MKYLALDIILWSIAAFAGICLGCVIHHNGLNQGLERERDYWVEWCLENGYASYKTDTGEFILHDKKYFNDYINEFFPEILKDFKDIEEDTPMNEDQPKRLPQTGLIPDHLAKGIDPLPDVQPAEYRPDYKAL